jgi:hypothetical protein
MVVQALATASNAATLTSLVFMIFLSIDLLSKQLKMRQGSQETASIVEMLPKWREMERNAEKGGRTAGARHPSTLAAGCPTTRTRRAGALDESEPFRDSGAREQS